jgi:hypothetical protein
MLTPISRPPLQPKGTLGEDGTTLPSCCKFAVCSTSDPDGPHESTANCEPHVFYLGPCLLRAKKSCQKELDFPTP